MDEVFLRHPAAAYIEKRTLKGSVLVTPTSASWSARSMRQSRLSDYQVDGEPAYKNEELLRTMYLVEEQNSYEIAHELDCHPSTVQRYLREFGIPRRGPNGTRADAQYKKEEWLRVNYLEEERPASELAEEEDVATSTIYTWLERHGIERRTAASDVDDDACYTDKEWLSEKYVEEGLSTPEIGEIADVHAGTIQSWLDRHDIPVRDEGREPLPFARMYVDSNGYIAWRSYDRETRSEEYVTVHRLLAVAHHGLDALKGHHVHHQNHIKWDNRIENLDLVPPTEHARHHAAHQSAYRKRDEKGRFRAR